MAAPQLTAYAQGQGVASGDGLNTFESTCNTFADLRAFIGLPGIQVWARGGGAINDGLGGPFYWNANANAPDDGLNVIVPAGSALGAWLRLAFFGTQKIGLAIFIEQPPTASEEFPIYLPWVACTLPVNLTTSRARIGTLPTATMTFTLTKNGTAIGTVSFDTAGVPTVTFTSEISFNPATDYFSVIAQASPDATGANISFTFVFTVTQ